MSFSRPSIGSSSLPPVYLGNTNALIQPKINTSLLQAPSEISPPQNGLRFGIPNETLSICWLNAALKFAASSGLLDNFFKVDIDSLIATKIVLREKFTITTKETIKQDISETKEKLHTFLSNPDSEEQLMLSKDQKSTLNTWCNILNLSLALDVLNDGEEICSSVFKEVLRDDLQNLNAQAVFELKATKEDLTCAEQIKKLKEQVPILKELQNDLFALIELLRSQSTYSPEIEILKNSILTKLTLISGQNLTQGQLDSWEFFDLINNAFEAKAVKLDVYAPEKYPLGDQAWNILEDYQNKDRETVFVHLERHKINEEGQDQLVNNPILFNANGLLEVRRKIIEDQSSKHTPKMLYLNPLFSVSAAVIYRGEATQQFNTFGHYAYIEKWLTDGFERCFLHNDQNIQELSFIQFLTLAKQAVILKLEKVPLKPLPLLQINPRQENPIHFFLEVVQQAKLALPKTLTSDSKLNLDAFLKPIKLSPLPEDGLKVILPIEGWLGPVILFAATSGILDHLVDLKFTDKKLRFLHNFLFAQIELLRKTLKDKDPGPFVLFDEALVLLYLIKESLSNLGITHVNYPREFYKKIEALFGKANSLNSNLITIGHSEIEQGLQSLNLNHVPQSLLLQPISFDDVHLLPIDSQRQIQIGPYLYKVKALIVSLDPGEFIILEDKNIKGKSDLWMHYPDGNKKLSSPQVFTDMAQCADLLKLEYIGPLNEKNLLLETKQEEEKRRMELLEEQKKLLAEQQYLEALLRSQQKDLRLNLK